MFYKISFKSSARIRFCYMCLLHIIETLTSIISRIITFPIATATVNIFEIFYPLINSSYSVPRTFSDYGDINVTRKYRSSDIDIPIHGPGFRE